MITPVNTPEALLTLLDALEAEILDTPAEDIQAAMRETARSPELACQEVRSLLEQAIRSTEDSPAAAIPHPLGNGLATYR